jgi:hypothetical protein
MSIRQALHVHDGFQLTITANQELRMFPVSVLVSLYTGLDVDPNHHVVRKAAEYIFDKTSFAQAQQLKQREFLRAQFPWLTEVDASPFAVWSEYDQKKFVIKLENRFHKYHLTLPESLFRL